MAELNAADKHGPLHPRTIRHFLLFTNAPNFDDFALVLLAAFRRSGSWFFLLLVLTSWTFYLKGHRESTGSVGWILVFSPVLEPLSFIKAMRLHSRCGSLYSQLLVCDVLAH
ncbi:hypothetical protein Q8A73_020750 [Channa argus]|nr:hypothetical protein Q8A73_020750 [Channa argus]